MAFGKRTSQRLRAAVAEAQKLDVKRRDLRNAAAGLLLGLGAVTAGTSFVQASERGGLFDFFGQIFGYQAEPRPSAQPQAVYRRVRKHYASLPDARSVTGTRARFHTPRPMPVAKAARALVAPAKGRRPLPDLLPPEPTRKTVCVRTCDGYLFPLGDLRSDKDIGVHQAACAAACPGAVTALFTLPAGESALDQSVGLDNRPYLASAYARVFLERRVQNCSCTAPGIAMLPLPIESDATARVGDVVATASGADVVVKLAKGGVALTDYRFARGISRYARRDIERQVGSLRREAAAREFERKMRAVESDKARIRVSDARLPPRRDSFGPVQAVAGFQPVRMASPLR